MDDDDSGNGKNWILILIILGCLGYLAYTNQDAIKAFNFKQLVGLENPTPAAAPTNTPPPFTPPAPVVAPTPETNDNSVPVVGRPRPVLPAHDHWTWTTNDGKTYQDVKVEKIIGDSVTIIHADGGTRLPISSLPTDIQQELNYYSTQAQQH